MKVIPIVLLFMVLVAGIDHYLRRNAEAVSGAAEISRLAQEAEKTQLRKDLEQAMAILEVCFDTPVSLDRVRSLPITLTAYSSTSEECDDTPHFTASAKPVRHGIISVSVDLLRETGLKFGQRVLIPGHGIFEVQDQTSPRLRRTVDIWVADRKAALLFGRQQGTIFWIAEETGAGEAGTTTSS